MTFLLVFYLIFTYTGPCRKKNELVFILIIITVSGTPDSEAQSQNKKCKYTRIDVIQTAKYGSMI